MTTRERVTNATLLSRYIKRVAAQEKKRDKAFLRMTRAVAFYTRMRNEHHYLRGRVTEITAAIENGEEYPKERERKKKSGRRIEL